MTTNLHNYKDGCNTTMAFLKCQHYWLKALDAEADHVRVLLFDFSNKSV